jgi:putative SOS response-associated peptidase YedK
MCGRYASTRATRALASIFEAKDVTGDEPLEPNFNVAPTVPVRVVRHRSTGERVVDLARWGLLPPWATDARQGARMINARAETLQTSPAFRTPFARRRCLVPADGWYEWLRNPDRRGKQAYYMTPKDSSVLAFAGLWQPWEGLLSTTIVTTAAVGDLAMVHDRMPLALPPERWSEWLESDRPPAALLTPPGLDWVAGIELRQVGPAVGDVRNNSESLIRPVTGSALGVEPAESADLRLF